VPNGECPSNEGDSQPRNGRCVSERARVAGVPDQLVLKRHRDLEGPRAKPTLPGVGPLEDVEWGVLETGGRLSFIRKH
jgi:hypothetical protein